MEAICAAESSEIMDTAVSSNPAAPEEEVETVQIVTEEAEDEVPVVQIADWTNYFFDYADLEIMKCAKREGRNATAQATVPPKLATSTGHEFSASNILKGCKWAPDGSCILTNSDDNRLRIFNLPEALWDLATKPPVENGSSESRVPVPVPEFVEPVLRIAEGGTVYDYSWYPFMNSTDPSTCCFVSSAADNPIHLIDAFDGSLRATYLPINHLEQIVAPHAVEFDLTGENIYCGFRDSIKIFNLQRPGADCTERRLKSNKLPDLNQPGIVSCFAFNPVHTGVYACGSFLKTIGLYLEDGTVMAILTGHFGGVTHLQFSHDGTKLISGGRKDSRLIVWDMRQLGDEYQILERDVDTNQRIYFDLTNNDRYLASGQTNGLVAVWDLIGTADSDVAKTEFRASTDCVNGASLNPRTPVLATTSGQRHACAIAADSDDEELFVRPNFPEDHSLALWNFS